MNEELYIGFESYLNNEMPSDEKMIFEGKLKNDTQFRENFNLYKETTQFLEHKFSSETTNFKNNLESISKAHFSETEEKEIKVVNLRPWYYAVAATMAIVFGALLFTQNNPQYGDYNQHQTAVFIERSDGDANLKAAQEFFNSQNYKKAVVSFEKINDLKNPELQLYYAISLIEISDYQKAEIFLTNIKSGTSVYKDKATWYLALSNLKQKKTAACKSYLKQIPEDAEDYDNAQQLLNDLE
jgi:hypothetical protein